MVFLVLSSEGFREVENEIEETQSSVWVSSNVLSREQVGEYRKAGMDLTVIDHAIDYADGEKLNQEIEVIQLHHPNETVTVQT